MEYYIQKNRGEGRIEGTIKNGKTCLILVDTPKLTDARYKKNKVN